MRMQTVKTVSGKSSKILTATDGNSGRTEEVLCLSRVSLHQDTLATRWLRRQSFLIAFFDILEPSNFEIGNTDKSHVLLPVFRLHTFKVSEWTRKRPESLVFKSF
eukprot:TRINITY_DN13047_c0_g1_i1.p1 TRINITY_DN13047_c0_g1~~TRINITY_DN13047_c0_g1_i1.p1  ORF type:complete len:105 (+),score=12.95 TRINITY_DN13047_c0_g1_i1:152-466(+)